jgi:GTP cyclohydrolase I
MIIEDGDVAQAALLLQRHAGLAMDEHGKDTPARFLHMLSELTACAKENDLAANVCMKFKAFPSNSDDMVIIRDIPFTSVCNHHLLPFTGLANVGYVPNGKIVGLSKPARVVQHFARRPQVQERLTSDIADYLEKALDPRGVAIVMSAEHQCMTIRGVQAPGTFTTTSTMRGVFGEHTRTAKAEFLQMIGQRR